METIQIVVKEPLQEPVIQTIPNTLEAKQALVDGWLEFVPFGEFDMYLNEEGKLNGLKANLRFPNDIVVGAVYLSKADEEGRDIGLTDEEAKEAIQLLQSYAITDTEEARYFDEVVRRAFQ